RIGRASHAAVGGAVFVDVGPGKGDAPDVRVDAAPRGAVGHLLAVVTGQVGTVMPCRRLPDDLAPATSAEAERARQDHAAEVHAGAALDARAWDQEDHLLVTVVGGQEGTQVVVVQAVDP